MDPQKYQTTKIKQNTTQKAKTRSNTDPPRYQTTKIKQHTTQKAKKMNNTDLTKISEVNLGARDVYLLLHALMRTNTGLCLKFTIFMSSNMSSWGQLYQWAGNVNIQLSVLVLNKTGINTSKCNLSYLKTASFQNTVKKNSLQNYLIY